MSSTPLRLALLAALLTTASGCSAGDPGAPAPSTSTAVPSAADTSSTTTAAPEATAATPGPAEASPAPAARVVLRRSGGFPGRDDTVTVEPDGRWTAVDRAGTRRTGRLGATALDQLRRLTAEPRLTEGGTADAAGRCSDAYEYRLTVGTATIDWTDCPVAGQPPQAASDLATLVFTAVD
ncbi:hypothetical protein [Micromonospora sp. RTGN7]|uniref:hypothetical protein n=1 Tax=Micromonospora sp. RTGN7 TaxID=3016526 RepID=UPI0029FEEFE6|nr:hypothetical protein [Micromonospora sp. RTGN7]